MEGADLSELIGHPDSVAADVGCSSEKLSLDGAFPIRGGHGGIEAGDPAEHGRCSGGVQLVSSGCRQLCGSFPQLFAECVVLRRQLPTSPADAAAVNAMIF